MIHQRPRKSKAFDLAEAQRLYGELKSYRKAAAALGSNYAAVYRALNATSTNGHPSASERIDSAPTLPQRVEVVGEPVSDAPAHQRASERIDHALLKDHDSRIAVLEAFMAAQQQRAHAADVPQRISASAQRIDPPVWVNRGTHLAADMIERVKTYAHEHRLEMREVIDLALRTFFAGEGGRDA
jgi:hypothetical protein